MKPKGWVFSGLGFLFVVTLVLFWQTKDERDGLQTRLAAVARGTTRLVRENAELRDEAVRAREQTATAKTELAAAQTRIQELAEKTDAAAVFSAESVQRWLGAANDPAVMRRLNLQARYQTLRAYADLFDQLKLEPGKEAELALLLADKRQSAVDVVVTAFQRGEDLSQEPTRYREIVAGAKAAIETQIKALLGDAQYAQYRDYDTSVAQANVLKNVELSLRGSAEPLTPEQGAQVKAILQGNSDARISAKMVEDARAFLSPLQLQVLQDLRAVQQADERRRIERLQVALTPLPVDPKDE